MLFTLLEIDSQHGYVLPPGRESDIIRGKKNHFDMMHNQLITIPVCQIGSSFTGLTCNVQYLVQLLY